MRSAPRTSTSSKTTPSDAKTADIATVVANAKVNASPVMKRDAIVARHMKKDAAGQSRSIGHNGGPAMEAQKAIEKPKDGVPFSPLSVLTDKQIEARALLFGPSRHVMLYGGSRSGKSFVALYAVIKRALHAAGSRHAIFRHRFNHLKRSIGLDTLPKVMATCFPGVAWKMDKTDWFVKLPNGSEIWLGGLDDKERTEKILGMEFCSLYFNECSQIGHHAIRMARTRLAQKCGLPLRAYYDANPPSRAHWSYKEFIEFKNPIDAEPLNKEMYGSILMNPKDNLANIPAEYIDELESLPLRDRLRFLDGIFATDDATMLWTYESIKRVHETPELDEVCVAVDPSGSAKGDEVGIVAVGRAGRDYYVLVDASFKATPQQWARKAIEVYDRPDILADALACETNFGGDMVEFTTRQVAQTMHRRGDRKSEEVNFRKVVSSRGKVLRAEPISALYEQGRVFHVGTHAKLEDEMTQFSTEWDRKANGSPNRVDALVFAVTHLMNRMSSDRPMIFGRVNLSG